MGSEGLAGNHNSPPVERTNGALTLLSVVGLVGGMLGLLGSLVPCFGAYASELCTPSAITAAAGVALSAALKVRRSTTTIVALLFALSGLGISSCQQHVLGLDPLESYR